MPLPFGGTEQTSSLVLDIDKNGLNDFVITARDAGPSVVAYLRNSSGWSRYVIETDWLPIAAGGALADIDGDADLDIVMGANPLSNEVWWWENPYPNYDQAQDWTRRSIKNSGGVGHHDQLFGDFDGDGAQELVFWNQGAKRLLLAEIPADPISTSPWPVIHQIFAWSSSTQLEDLAAGDVDNDGVVDIVGGGRWFKHNGDGTYTANLIDSSQEYGRAAVGQLKKGDYAEVVFVAGDAAGPLKWYEFDGSSWHGTQLLAEDVDHGHSLQIADMNNDGNLDIFAAEMRIRGDNPDAKAWFFSGDGRGNFVTTEVMSGYGNHESKLADLDGDGDLDILGKPFNWETPRLDIWLNEGCHVELDQWERHVIDPARPWRAIFVYPGDLNNDGLVDIVSGGWWYRNPGTVASNWIRSEIGAPLNNVAAVYDFDGDGYLDILGTQAEGSAANASFAWAKNDGAGNFTIFTNIEDADGDFLQGVAVDRFLNPSTTEVALSWHLLDPVLGIQGLTVPALPSTNQWQWREMSPVTLRQGLSAGDIDRDGDTDLMLGTTWLRNDSTTSSDWSDASRRFRVLVEVNAGGFERKDVMAQLNVNVTELLRDLGQSGAPDLNSLRVVEVDEDNQVISSSVPFQFDEAGDFEGTTNTSGTLSILLVGQTGANETRRFYLYFDVQRDHSYLPADVTPRVILSDNETDEGFASLKIVSERATYFFHKDGGGFSSLNDNDGNDWISCSTTA
ncbi:MAG: FG-GAP repeat domain-containing protein [Candidatus Promineifilaceae bacterium]